MTDKTESPSAGAVPRAEDYNGDYECGSCGAVIPDGEESEGFLGYLVCPACSRAECREA